jgi:hypothetical protein
MKKVETGEYNDLLGKGLEEAKKLVPEGKTIRVIVKDGNHYATTLNYDENRINVWVDENDIITSVWGIG